MKNKQQAVAKPVEKKLIKMVKERQSSVRKMSALSQFRMQTKKLYSKSQKREIVDHMNRFTFEKIGNLGEPVYKTGGMDLESYRSLLEDKKRKK